MIGKSAAPVPLHVLTGFLGSGKSTVVARLLADAEEPIAVIVNEVGALGLDGTWVEEMEEDVLLLAGGCVCCALRDDVRNTVKAVRARGATRIVLETTGLADPAPLLHTFATDAELRELVGLGGVICVLDVPRAESLLAEHPESRRQLDFADRVLITHADRGEPGRLAGLQELVTTLAPGREVRVAEHGRVDPDWLLGPAPLRAPSFHLPATHDPYEVHHVRHEGVVDLQLYLLWLQLVTQVDGPALLRTKARLTDATGSWWVQSANRHVAPPSALVGKSSPGAEVMLVIRGMSERATELLLTSLRQALAGD